MCYEMEHFATKLGDRVESYRNGFRAFSRRMLATASLKISNQNKGQKDMKEAAMWELEKEQTRKREDKFSNSDIGAETKIGNKASDWHIEGNGEVGLEMFLEAWSYMIFRCCGEIVLHSHGKRESLEKLNEA